MKKIDRKTIFYYGIYAAFLFFYLWMAAQIPYTHDDWDWGLPVGIQQLITANLNSRYAGNFFEVVMTRSTFLKTVIMGTGYFLIPFLISDIAVQYVHNNSQQKRINCFILANILLLIMDRRIWQQTYGWVAGFANFSISTVFLLICIRECMPAFVLAGNSPETRLKCGTMFIVSAVTQLFLENITLYLVLLLLIVNVYNIWKTHKLSQKYVAMLLGAICGMIIMFSSDIYEALAATGEAVGGYRQTSFSVNGGIREMIHGCLIQALALLLMIWDINFLTCIAVLLIMIWAILRKGNQKNIRFWLKVALFSLNILMLVHVILRRYCPISMRWGVLVLTNLLFFLLIIVDILFLFYGNNKKIIKLWTVWLSVPIVILPLCVILEMGPRLFFTTNALMILFAVMISCESYSETKEKGQRLFLVSGLIATSLLMGFYGNIYYQINRCYDQRLQILQTAVEQDAQSVLLPAYPYKEYLWIPDPTQEQRWIFFKEFYKLPADMDIAVEPYDLQAKE